MLELFLLGAECFDLTPVFLDVLRLAEGVARNDLCVFSSEPVVKHFFYLFLGLVYAKLGVDASDNERVVRDKIVDEGIGRVELEPTHFMAEKEQEDVGNHYIKVHQSDAHFASYINLEGVSESQPVEPREPRIVI